MQVFDRRLLALLTFLTRRQAWLTPGEIAPQFRLEGRQFTPRTIFNWFAFLKSQGLVYYPYPRANLLGLQETLVTIHGLRDPSILAIMPFGASFEAHMGPGDSRSAIHQGYWVPSSARNDFREFWETARDLSLLEEVDIFESKNKHFLYSPFHEVVTEAGFSSLEDPVDNSYFGRLLDRHLRERYEIGLGPWVETSPILVPIVLEHIWACASSRQIWSLIRARGEREISRYVQGKSARALANGGSALRLLQRQWRGLLLDFETAFLQPRVQNVLRLPANGLTVSLTFEPGSVRRMVESAVEISSRSLGLGLMPGLQRERECNMVITIPSNQIVTLLKIAEEYHRGNQPPSFSIQDTESTNALFNPVFCKVDWRLFDPTDLCWQFDIDGYLGRLHKVKTKDSAIEEILVS